MDPGLEEALEVLLDSEILDNLQDSVVKRLQQLEHPRHAIWEARSCKDTGNVLFKAQEFSKAVMLYERGLQFLCATSPICKQDVDLMTELGVTLNSNLAACWLRLNQFEGAKFHCELAMKFDTYNVKVRYRRALALLNLGLVDDARMDLEIALKFEPKNKFVLKELQALEEKYGIKGGNQTSFKELDKGKKAFDPLGISPHSKRTQDKSEDAGPSGEETAVQMHHDSPPIQGEAEVDKKNNPQGSMHQESLGHCDAVMSESIDIAATEYLPPLEPPKESSKNKISNGRLGINGVCVQKDASFGITSKSVEHPEKASGMDIDNEELLSSLTQEAPGENPDTTVGTGPAAEEICSNTVKRSTVTNKDEFIVLTNARCPNRCIKISRKDYQRLANGQQLIFVRASRHEFMNVRVLYGSMRNDEGQTGMDTSPSPEEGERWGGGLEEDASSTTTVESSTQKNRMECEEKGENNIFWFSAQPKKKPKPKKKVVVQQQKSSSEKEAGKRTSEMNDTSQSGTTNHSVWCRKDRERSKRLKCCPRDQRNQPYQTANHSTKGTKRKPTQLASEEGGKPAKRRIINAEDVEHIRFSRQRMLCRSSMNNFMLSTKDMVVTSSVVGETHNLAM